MMAAISAAQEGHKVILLEKMDQAGRKLRITGKGRCNLTNMAPLKEFLGHIGSDSRFLRNCFSRFFNQDLYDFFEERGVKLVTERGERVFPQSGKSLDIFLALIQEIEKSPNITFHKNKGAKRLIIEEGTLKGVVLQNGEEIYSSTIIIATGGQSYPSTGSTGIGYRLAKEAGHTVIQPVPSLVALNCSEALPKELTTLTLRNVGLTITDKNNKLICSNFGELQFFNHGISGPITLSASRHSSRLLHDGQTLYAHIDLKPAISRDTLDKRLIADLNNNGTRIFNDALRMWIPAELVTLALQQLHIEYYKRLNQINGAERKRIVTFLKDITLTLTGTKDYNEAIVTQGGVSLNEINPKTMESKLIKGLYFVGEVLDLDADTGGYNLQIAFSTGYIAGKSI